MLLLLVVGAVGAVVGLLFLCFAGARPLLLLLPMDDELLLQNEERPARKMILLGPLRLVEMLRMRCIEADMVISDDIF